VRSRGGEMPRLSKRSVDGAEPAAPLTDLVDAFSRRSGPDAVNALRGRSWDPPPDPRRPPARDPGIRDRARRPAAHRHPTSAHEVSQRHRIGTAKRSSLNGTRVSSS
jgi:hypothetical protein